MRFSRKKGPDQSQNHYLNNQLIKLTTSQSDLSILVSNNLKWSLHINNLVSKANKMLGFIRRNCFHLAEVNARRLLYLTLVRSQLSPGCEVWAPQGASSDLFRLECIERRSTKFILNDYESCYVDRHKKLNLIPISYWLEIKDIVFYYKYMTALYDLDIN